MRGFGFIARTATSDLRLRIGIELEPTRTMKASSISPARRTIVRSPNDFIRRDQFIGATLPLPWDAKTAPLEFASHAQTNWTPAGLYCARHNAGKTWVTNAPYAYFLGNLAH